MVCEEGERAERLENLRGCWEAVVNEAENAVGLKKKRLKVLRQMAEFDALLDSEKR